MQTTPNFLTSLQSTNMDLQSKLTQTNKEKPTPVLNFKPMSVKNSTPASKVFKQNTTKGRGATNLFSDEQSVFERMLADGLSEEKAKEVITEKRKKQLSDITQEESKALQNMMADGITSEKAVEIVRKNRYKNLPLYKKALKVPFDASVGAVGMATEQVGNVAGFLGAEGIQETGREIRDIGERITGDSKAAKAGEIILGTGEVIATGPTKLAGTLKGRTLQGALVGGVTGAGAEVLGEGSDTTVGQVAKEGAIGASIGAAATPVLEKAVIPAISGVVSKGAKYGTAGMKGGFTGLGKSIGRDIKRPITEIKTKGIAPKKAYDLSTKANRFNAKDIEDFQRMTGETPGEFAVKRGMTKTGDQAVEEAVTLYKKSMKEADSAIELIDGKFKMDKGTDFLGEMLGDLSNRLSKTLSKDAKKVNTLLKKYNEGGLSMSEINDIKRLYSRNHKYTWVDAGSESALRSKNLQDGVREWQFSTAKAQGLKNLREINKTTQGWRAFSDNLSKKLKRSSGNNNISITDWIALSGGEPTNIALFLGKKVGEMPGVKSGIIKGLGKQTKPATIKATRDTILQSNKLKRDITTRNILRDRTGIGSDSKRLALPEGKTPKAPIITPQTAEKAVIQESKRDLSRAKIGTTKLAPQKTQERKLAPKQEVKSDMREEKLAPVKKLNPQAKKKLAPTKGVQKKNEVTAEYKIAEKIAQKVRAEKINKEVDSFEKNIVSKYIDDIKNQGKKISTKTGKKDVFGKDDILYREPKSERIIEKSLSDVGYNATVYKKGESMFSYDEIPDNLRNFFKEVDGEVVTKERAVLLWNDTDDKVLQFIPIEEGNITKDSLLDIFKSIKDTEINPTKLPIAPNQMGLINRGGYIDPIAMVQDISKVLKNLTPKNTYNIATQISKKLGVEVQKVHTILKEYVSKYGEKLKDKLADLADDIADKTGARAKLLAGENAKFAPTSLEKAKMMDKLGDNADDIWKKTGWEKGADGKWRFEIDDSKAKLKEFSKIDRTSKLGDIIEHKDMLNNYPEIKDVFVSFSKTQKGASNIKGQNHIRLGKNSFDEIKKDTTKLEKELEGIYSQARKKESELLKKGISEKKVNDELYKLYLKDIQNLEKQIDNADVIGYKLNKQGKSDLLHEIQHQIQQYENFVLGGDSRDLGFSEYLKLAGETEARNVQTRLGKTASERKKLAPSKTEDVPRNKQILNSDSKIMQSVSGKGTGISGKIDAPKEFSKYMDDNVITTHRITEEKLEKVLGNIQEGEFGGKIAHFKTPSYGISKDPFQTEYYGDIVFIPRKHYIDRSNFYKGQANTSMIGNDKRISQKIDSRIKRAKDYNDAKDFIKNSEYGMVSEAKSKVDIPLNGMEAVIIPESKFEIIKDKLLKAGFEGDIVKTKIKINNFR